MATAAIRDVSLRKQAEQALRESERRLRLIADALPALVAYVDSDLRYGFVNAAFQEWFGMPAALIEGQRAQDLLGDEAFRLVEPRIHAALAGKRITFEERMPYKRGERFVHTTYVPRVDDSGKVEGFYVLVTDITNLKKAEEAARQAERLASLGTLAAGIAHEINNPLSAARTSAEVALAVKDKPGAGDMLEECLATIVSAVKRCDQIVRNVLRLSRDEPSDKSSHDVNQVVQSAVSTAAVYLKPRNVSVRLELDESSAAAKINPLELERVLLNLIQNAAEASAPGAVVAVSTVQRPEVIQVVVEDNGCGMSPDEARRIFDPFYTNRKDGLGTGLGLSLAEKIVREHGGRIAVKSALGRGSTFTLELPKAGSEGS